MLYFLAVIKNFKTLEETLEFGEQLGRQLRGGMVVELIGDIGAGKTTLTKGIARGLDIDEDVQSPSFTINRTYDARDGLRLAHYDFYRLADPGIMIAELSEATSDPGMIVIVEWATVVEHVLPDDRLTISITSPTETSRQLTITPDDILENNDSFA